MAMRFNMILLFNFPGMSDCTKDRRGCYNRLKSMMTPKDSVVA